MAGRAAHATTIAAICSPPGAGARGVIRVSGPDSARVVSRALGLEGAARPGARAVLRGRLDDGRGRQPALLLWMPGPHSYTREDVAELHLCGSPWLLEAALQRLCELGAVLAQPGEFTRRAFESGRIDLFEAEGVLELIEASSEEQRRAAAGLLFGGLGARVEALRDGLEELRALCEASLDFDESETGHVATEELLELATRVGAQLEAALAWEERREPLSGLPRIVLAGAPNAGKSSLFNRLAASGRALVSDLEGTTRDFVSGLWQVRGVACRLLDTAGLDAALARGAEPDRRAQDLAREQQTSAHLVLWLADAQLGTPQGMDELPEGTRRLLVWSRCDRLDARERGARPDGLWVSAHTGEGLEALSEAVAGALDLAPRGGPRAVAEAIGPALSLRHRRALGMARDELERARDLLLEGAPLDLAAGSLRQATDALDGISGRTTPEDLLERIFARFCLGK